MLVGLLCRCISFCDGLAVVSAIKFILHVELKIVKCHVLFVDEFLSLKIWKPCCPPHPDAGSSVTFFMYNVLNGKTNNY